MGLAELQKVTRELVRLRTRSPTCAASSPRSAPTARSSSSTSTAPRLCRCRVPLNDVFQTLQTYLGSSFVNLFNSPTKASRCGCRPMPSSGEAWTMSPICTSPISRAIGAARRSAEDQSDARNQLVIRYNLYPAANVFGAAAPGSSSGQALNLMEQVAKNNLPGGMAYDWTSISYQGSWSATRSTSSLPSPSPSSSWCWRRSSRTGSTRQRDPDRADGSGWHLIAFWCGFPRLSLHPDRPCPDGRAGSQECDSVVEFARELRAEGKDIVEAPSRLPNGGSGRSS